MKYFVFRNQTVEPFLGDKDTLRELIDVCIWCVFLDFVWGTTERAIICILPNIDCILGFSYPCV